MHTWDYALFIYDENYTQLYAGFCVDRLAYGNPISIKLKKIVKTFYGVDFFNIRLIWNFIGGYYYVL